MPERAGDREVQAGGDKQRFQHNCED